TTRSTPGFSRRRTSWADTPAAPFSGGAGGRGTQERPRPPGMVAAAVAWCLLAGEPGGDEVADAVGRLVVEEIGVVFEGWRDRRVVGLGAFVEVAGGLRGAGRAAVAEDEHRLACLVPDGRHGPAALGHHHRPPHRLRRPVAQEPRGD